MAVRYPVLTQLKFMRSAEISWAPLNMLQPDLSSYTNLFHCVLEALGPVDGWNNIENMWLLLIITWSLLSVLFMQQMCYKREGAVNMLHMKLSIWASYYVA